MYLPDVATAVTVRPTATAPGPNPGGWFSDGNPALAIPRTILNAEILNMVVAELANAVTGTGQTLSKTNSGQLLAAIGGMSGRQALFPLAGTNHTYSTADVGRYDGRSNGGVTMVDTLPTGLPVGTSLSFYNADNTAFLLIGAGAGSAFTVNAQHASSPWIILGPGQNGMAITDGINWQFLVVPSRARAQATINLYFATTGNDVTNNGMVATSPFADIQACFDFAMLRLDVNGFQVIAVPAAGTYGTGLIARGQLVGAMCPIVNTGVSGAGGATAPPLSSCGAFVIGGPTVTPGTVLFQVNSGKAIFEAGSGSSIVLNNISLASTGSQTIGVMTDPGGSCAIHTGTNFGSFVAQQIWNSGTLLLTGNYTISGGGNCHILGNGSGGRTNYSPITVTVSSVAFSQFANVSNNASLYCENATFSGPATGQRYLATLNGVINSNGAGAGLLPGNVAGSTSTGGQYA